MKIIKLITLILFSFWASLGAQKENKQVYLQNTSSSTLEQLEELHIRGGLPNFFSKVTKARHIHIGYLGGSITAAEDGWREQTYNWFRVQYPQVIITHNNAGIGGTGSSLGVFRVETDLLKDNPDLVFVEFAVNDGGQPKENVIKTMEGIVRKLRTLSPKTDICFVYTVDDSKCEVLMEGQFDNAVHAMETVADHYQIPSIHMGIEVAKLRKSGKLTFAADLTENTKTIVFTKDHVHPLSVSGHPLYANVVARNILKIRDAQTSVKCKSLPAPLYPDNWEKAQKINVADLPRTGSCLLLPESHEFMKMFSGFIPQIYRVEPGTIFSFSFTGTTIGIYDVVGPMAGKIKLTIDGKAQEFTRFDKYCTYNRLGYLIMADHLENKRHTIELEFLDETVDKENILPKGDQEFYRKNKKLNNKTAYYIGNVLIVGTTNL